MAAATDTPLELSEESRVYWNRYEEARLAGMGQDEARVFAADHHLDVGLLRQLVAAGCPADLLSTIVL